MGSKWSKKPTKNPSDSSGDVDEQERNTKARCWASPYVLTRQG